MRPAAHGGGPRRWSERAREVPLLVPEPERKRPRSSSNSLDLGAKKAAEQDVSPPVTSIQAAAAKGLVASELEDGRPAELELRAVEGIARWAGRLRPLLFRTF